MLYSGREQETKTHEPSAQNEHKEVVAPVGHWILFIIICIITLGLFAIIFITKRN